MSSSVACSAQTQNLMTYLSLTEAGTMCSLPDSLMVERSFWFSSSEPRRRKQTRPTCIFYLNIFFGISDGNLR